MNTCGIYALCEPTTTKAVRYIGQSVNVEQRYRQHCSGVADTPVGKWIEYLKGCGRSPVCKVLQECSRDKLDLYERHWISMYNVTGDLLNVMHGNLRGMSEGETRKWQQAMSLAVATHRAFPGHYVLDGEPADEWEAQLPELLDRYHGATLDFLEHGAASLHEYTGFERYEFAWDMERSHIAQCGLCRGAFEAVGGRWE